MTKYLFPGMGNADRSRRRKRGPKSMTIQQRMLAIRIAQTRLNLKDLERQHAAAMAKPDRREGGEA